MLAELRERGESFSQFALRQSRRHAEYFRSQPLDADEQARFEALARESLAEQARLEAEPDLDFDTFVAAYQASILGLISN
ncbi:Glutamate--cysteine ligase [compost metagenome]